MPGDCSRSDSMERAALKQSQPCGSWERKERLGTGGFGHVYLYQHLVSSVIHLYISENMNRVCLWFVLTPCMCSQQESGEKIAVKLCRLELNSKNKDRWTREIQIMKKWAVIVCLNRQGVIWTYFTVHCVVFYCDSEFGALYVQAKSRERCSGQRCSSRVELHCDKWSTTASHGVLLKRRPTQGSTWIFNKNPKHFFYLLKYPSNQYNSLFRCWINQKIVVA